MAARAKMSSSAELKRGYEGRCLEAGWGLIYCTVPD